MTAPSTPKGLRMPTPRAEIDAMPPARQPLSTSKGVDVISITTRMRETPVKKGR